MTSKILLRAKGKLKSTFDRGYKRYQVKAASCHVFGPKKVVLESDEVALVCMLKNGAFYLKHFLKHYRSIGIRHFLFIDNGSDDETIEILSGEKDVTIFLNTLPVSDYECNIRSHIAKRVFSGGWFLFSDSDELIDMTYGENRNIEEYTRYCNEHNYDVVVGQCLDMFSSLPLSATASWSFEKSVENFVQFSLQEIDEFDYYDDKNVQFSWYLRNNKISNPEIKIKFGGIRREVFGEYCALTVHRMVRNHSRVEIYTHPHCCSSSRCADFNMLIRHYKFAGPYLSRERHQASTKVWQHGEDLQRLSKIENTGFTITGRAEKRFVGTSQLVAEGFLVCSQEFETRFN